MTQKRLLCFGDSNTYGWMGSLDGATRRYPSSIRWTGRLARMLGPRWEVLEEGLGGRTLHDNFTVGNGMTIPGAGLSAGDYLPACLLSHLPLDIVVIMLGSNDMKSALKHSAEDIAAGMEKLLDLVLEFPWQQVLDYPHPRVLLLSPPLIGERKMSLAGARYAGAPETSRALAGLYRRLAEEKGAAFLDAASVLTDAPAGEAHGVDGMHLDERDHTRLAEAVFEKVKNLFPLDVPSSQGL